MMVDIRKMALPGPRSPNFSLSTSLFVVNRTQDSGQVYSTQNYKDNTSMLNKYGPDIIKNTEKHVGRPLLRS